VGLAWKPGVLRVIEEATAATPGALIETKAASIAWHYRMAEPLLGAERADDLWRRLERRIEGEPVELLRGEKVVEVRAMGVHKGVVVGRVLADNRGGDRSATAIVAMGDDATDDDLFRALPPDAVTISVGFRPSSALFRVARPAAARAVLREILEGRAHRVR
jgi:trehalose 6-phosphate synthase/phosphatase